MLSEQVQLAFNKKNDVDRFDFDTFGILVLILLRTSGPKTRAGPSVLLRKRFGFDRFDNISVSV